MKYNIVLDEGAFAPERAHEPNTVTADSGARGCEMNDNDIIKALRQCAAGGSCRHCPLEEEVGCRQKLLAYAKAEIEGLCNKLNVSNQNVENMARSMPNIAKATRAEAIKEFAERLMDTRGDLGGIEMVAVGNIDAIMELMMEE